MFGFSFFSHDPSRFGETDYMNVKRPYFDVASLLSRGSAGTDGQHSLGIILDRTEEATGSAQPMTDTAADETTDAASDAAVTEVDHTICCECEAAPSESFCRECGDAFCPLCYTINHRKGRRALHRPLPLSAAASSSTASAGAPGPSDAAADEDAAADGVVTSSSSSAEAAARVAALTVAQDAASSAAAAALSASESARLASLIAADSGDLPEWWRGAAIAADWFEERAKHIPLRPTHEERKLLRLLQGVLRSSAYANRVDKPFKTRAARTRACLLEVVSVLTALVAGADAAAGRAVLKGADLAPLAPFFQNIFELGRRHKIRNPEKMRLSYAQLLYLLQDTESPEIQEQLGFSCVMPVRTVYSLLEELGALPLLRDPRLAAATQVVVHVGKTRAEIEAVKAQRDRALKGLLDTYSTRRIPRETLNMAIYSIMDNHSFLRTSRDYCTSLIDMLQHHFSPSSYDPADPTTCLAIAEGADGARLTHSHAAQYHYVLQSLCLWRDILDDFFRLWSLAELDLVDVSGGLGLGRANPYTLAETGQGLHRLQPAPRTDRALRKIVQGVQSKASNWVGSAVIHLGDNNVPNAYHFIDKYNQVSRILAPVVLCVQGLSRFDAPDAKAPQVRVRPLIRLGYRDTEHARRTVLCDFFKSAFDGSGSDSFFEAGSCIDGRLTSAWHWCNTLPSKSFFPLFLVTGFVGFDGADFES